MKKSILFKTVSLLFFFAITLSYGRAGTEKTLSGNDKVCLEVFGIAVDSNNIPLNGVHVKLFKENDELEWIEVTNASHHDHSFIFTLNVNEYYTIEVSKPGFITRSVAVSTKIPSGVKLDDLFHFEFEVTLLKQKKNLDDYYLDFPVGLISYNTDRDVFDNNDVYTKHIKTHINNSYNQAKN